MSSINLEPLDIVLNNYEIEVLGTRSESYKEKKGVWWIQTPTGFKILKKISNSESTLKYILHAVEHLSKNGINIPKVNKTRNGNDYVAYEGTCYVLSDAIHGKNPSYDSPAELSKAVKELAKFHKASKGFEPPSDTKPKYHLGTWIEDYLQQVEEMAGFYSDEEFLNQFDAIGRIIRKEFPYFRERANKSIEGLRNREYKEWVEKVKASGCLCHQDFAAGNLILDANGKLFVLDTDSITIDIPARDIRKLLNKIMKKAGKWDIGLTKEVLGYYHQENPLTASEWKVVKLDLMFPHLFIGAMNKYCYKRDKEWSLDKYLQRIKEMSEFDKTVDPVLDCFESIIPR